MLSSIPEDEKAALIAATNTILTGLPALARKEALELIDKKLWERLYGEDVALTEAHREAFDAMMKLWLAGEDPYSYYFSSKDKVWTGYARDEDPYACVPLDLIKLGMRDLAALRELYDKTKIESFQFVHNFGHGLWRTTCRLRVGLWWGQLEYRYHPTRNGGYPETSYSLFGYTESGAYEKVHWRQIEAQLEISVPSRILGVYIELVGQDLLHRGANDDYSFSRRMSLGLGQ